MKVSELMQKLRMKPLGDDVVLRVRVGDTYHEAKLDAAWTIDMPNVSASCCVLDGVATRSYPHRELTDEDRDLLADSL